MTSFLDEETDLTGEDSFEKVKSEGGEIDFSDEFTPESKSQRRKAETTDLCAKKHQSRMVAYQKIDDDLVEFPAHIKFKEEMNIEDVLMDNALHFLPAKVLARFKTVAKYWNLKISTPIFSRDQSYYFQEISGFFCQYENDMPTFVTLDHSAYGVPSPSLQFLPERVLVRSSCSGLLLCEGCNDEIFYICNPVSKEWEVISSPKSFQGSKSAVVLVFDPSLHYLVADYQLICATPQIDFPAIFFDIYSSKRRSWEYNAADCWDLGNVTLKDGSFYLNGVVYWETSSGEVLCFELNSKVSGTLLLPPDTTPHGVLTQMDGELCYIHAHNKDGNANTMDIYGGMKMSLKHSILLDVELVWNLNTGCRTLACVNGDVIVVLVGDAIYSFQLKNQKVEVISGFGNKSSSSYLPYVNSLPSLG